MNILELIRQIGEAITDPPRRKKKSERALLGREKALQKALSAENAKNTAVTNNRPQPSSAMITTVLNTLSAGVNACLFRSLMDEEFRDKNILTIVSVGFLVNVLSGLQLWQYHQWSGACKRARQTETITEGFHKFAEMILSNRYLGQKPQLTTYMLEILNEIFLKKISSNITVRFDSSRKTFVVNIDWTKVFPSEIDNFLMFFALPHNMELVAKFIARSSRAERILEDSTGQKWEARIFTRNPGTMIEKMLLHFRLMGKEPASFNHIKCTENLAKYNLKGEIFSDDNDGISCFVWTNMDEEIRNQPFSGNTPTPISSPILSPLTSPREEIPPLIFSPPKSKRWRDETKFAEGPSPLQSPRNNGIFVPRSETASTCSPKIPIRDLTANAPDTLKRIFEKDESLRWNEISCMLKSMGATVERKKSTHISLNNAKTSLHLGHSANPTLWEDLLKKLIVLLEDAGYTEKMLKEFNAPASRFQ